MRLKHAASIPIIAGLNLPAEPGEPTWPRYVRTTDILSPRALGQDVVRVPPQVLPRFAVLRGDLLFCRTGSLGTVYFHTGAEVCAFAGYLVRVRPDRSRVVPEFLAYWAESHDCRRQIMAGRIRSTIDNFSASKIANLRIPRLPLDHQGRVVGFLDRECARIAELNEKAREMAGGAVDEVLESLRGVVLDSGWPMAPVKYYARTGTGHTPSRTHPEYWAPDECVVPWFTLADVNQIRDGRAWVVDQTAERISERGLAHSSAEKHPAGTVLLSRTASVGFSAVMGTGMAVSQDFMTWTCGPDLDPYYLLVALRVMQPELRRLMYGSTHKTIYMPDLHALRVPLPPIDEQRSIVREARERFSRAWALRDELVALDSGLAEYQYSLIAEAVAGRLDVSRVSDLQATESLASVVQGPQPAVSST